MATQNTAVKSADSADRGRSLTSWTFLEDLLHPVSRRDGKYHPAFGDFFIPALWIGRKERSSCAHWVIRFR
jgi:hypothetical protein